MRYLRGHFVVTGPDIEPLKLKSRREANDWCAEELSPNFGDGRGLQAAAARACDLRTSIPSENFAPRMTFGNWL